MTVEALFEILNSERKTGEVIARDKNFYEKVENSIKSTSDGNALDNKDTQAKNLSKLLANVKEVRKRKILVYLAYNRKMPSPMPAEEEALYNRIINILNSKPEETKIYKLKITEEIPEIIMPSGGKIGPFHQNQIVELLDDAEMNFIIMNKIGERI